MSTARLSRVGCLHAFPVVSVLTGLGLLALVFPALATYEEGEAAYSQRDYSKAFVVFKEAAERSEERRVGKECRL